MLLFAGGNYDIIFVGGYAVDAVLSFCYDKRHNAGLTRNDVVSGVMYVIYIVISAIKTFEQVSVSRTVFPHYTFVDNRIVWVFSPRSIWIRSCCIPYRVVYVSEMVARVEHIVHSVPFYYCRTLHNWNRLVVWCHFPCICATEDVFEGSFLDATLLQVKLRNPQVVALVESYMVEIYLTIVIPEEERVNILLAVINRSDFLLREWSEYTFGCVVDIFTSIFSA